MSIKKTAALMGLSILTVLVVAPTAQAGTCRDPWVDQAIREVTGREPNGNYESGDCNVRNFNNASWNSYVELKRYVRGYFARPAVVTAPTLATSGVRPTLNTSYNPQLATSVSGNRLIGDGGGTLRRDAYGNLIGDGGGTLRRDAYGNLIGHDGATARSNNSN